MIKSFKVVRVAEDSPFFNIKVGDIIKVDMNTQKLTTHYLELSGKYFCSSGEILEDSSLDGFDGYVFVEEVRYEEI